MTWAWDLGLQVLLFWDLRVVREGLGLESGTWGWDLELYLIYPAMQPWQLSLSLFTKLQQFPTYIQCLDMSYEKQKQHKFQFWL